eukprot:TRINITY_DN776_c0_g1_i2.p1 TRINITY_DN776_c0_g1~~TRINITY_DN776_c0_g1_i2.p1  ORF type:complete len:490 (-),score=72.68 TRINITY_DN776_c0_g1_i2:38-1507(-)
MAFRLPLQGRAHVTKALQPARLLCTSRPALNVGMPGSPMLNHRQEDRLHRVRGGEAGRLANPDTLNKLRANRPQVFLTMEQRTLLNSLKQTREAMDWEAALGTLNQMPPNAGTDWLPIYRAILTVVCRCLRYEEAHMVWRRLPERDVMSYNCMIGMCSRLQRFEEVDALLQQMQADGIEKSGITYSQMIGTCAESQRWNEALELLGELKSKPALEQTTNWEVVYLMSMTSCARAGQSEQVRSLLHELRECGKDARVHNSHYNAVIVSCGNDGAAAERVLQEMKESGLTPRAPDWRAVMTCNRDSKEQQRIYLMMRQEMPHAPLEEAWAVLLRTAINSEDFEAADWVLQEMRANGCDPDSEKSSATPSLRRALSWYAMRQQRMQRMQQAGDQWPQTAGGFAAAQPQTAGGQWPQTAGGFAAQPQTTGGQWPQTAGGFAAAQQPSAPSASAAPPQVPLPPGWESAVDPNSGHPYYWRSDNPAATTTWERPV